MLVALEDNVLADVVREDGICNEFSILSGVTALLYYNKYDNIFSISKILIFFLILKYLYILNVKDSHQKLELVLHPLLDLTELFHGLYLHLKIISNLKLCQNELVIN